jgi:hypothetical protein
LYRNGVHVGGHDNVEFATTRLPLHIGGVSNGWGFRGWLDDLQFYSRPLKEAELQSMVKYPGECAITP